MPHLRNSWRITRFKPHPRIRIPMDKGSKRPPNSQKEYEESLAGKDPTQTSHEDLEDLAREAVKKFKSMNG